MVDRAVLVLALIGLDADPRDSRLVVELKVVSQDVCDISRLKGSRGRHALTLNVWLDVVLHNLDVRLGDGVCVQSGPVGEDGVQSWASVYCARRAGGERGGMARGVGGVNLPQLKPLARASIAGGPRCIWESVVTLACRRSVTRRVHSPLPLRGLA